MPSLSLHARLACACNLAYDVVADGDLPTPAETAAYRSASNFLGGVAAFSAGFHDINACLVGRLGGPGDATTAIVVAFRGTLPPRMNGQIPHDMQIAIDWINNINADLQRFAWLPADHPDILIHDGFGAALDSIWVNVRLAILAAQATAPDAPVVFTGHSKGGALATLAGLRWLIEENKPTSVVTFAAPRAGNRAFRDFYFNARVTHERYEFADDLVPHLPPTMGGLVDHLASLPFIGPRFSGIAKHDYEHVGLLRYVTRSGEVRADSDELHFRRHVALAGKIVSQDLPRLALDHRIALTGDDGGYLRAVAPDGI